MSNIINIKVEKVVSALKDAGNGQIIYDALCHVPDVNLRHMRNMISDILERCPNCCSEDAEEQSK